MSRLANILGAAALFGAAASGAHAALPFGTLSFVQPDGTAGASDVIDIVVRFTLSQDSDPFAVDADGLVTAGGPSEQELLDRGFAVDAPYTTAISYSAGCSGSFLGGNCGGPYAFNFGFGFSNISLQPGESVDFLFGRLSPNGGTAAPGIYNFYSAQLQVVAYRIPENGPYQEARFTLADTCPNGDDLSCDFTRTVRAGGGGIVPEPSTWALMILGFGAAGSALRANRRRALPGPARG
ncbi:MAG: PEPxxWA-CTERM sorting domain-containing protein [Phenylobacterium sp.]|uniref:PEPxxWA-CTERM sorting domain-containing protein n=1 Tax=Phenylobacterium sp. TaxID=1871053 RepID=UPI001A401766|nr:PEPxxWA-CTERM sorting domain-containing protein [Phenylobacterium sp.]MBL8772788.1 PEPxxWA-CTERM sorting domain-containing protein [Phenylobacterium sp.]